VTDPQLQVLGQVCGPPVSPRAGERDRMAEVTVILEPARLAPAARAELVRICGPAFARIGTVRCCLLPSGRAARSGNGSFALFRNAQDLTPGCLRSSM